MGAAVGARRICRPLRDPLDCRR